MSDVSKVWFVSGSSRGLGRAIVEAALSAGKRVVATARKPEDLRGLIERFGEQVLSIALDVTDAEAAKNAIATAVEHFGRVDYLVNNAGYADVSAIEDISLSDFRAQVDANFFGVVYLTHAVLPVLRAQGGGHIFQISSVGGRLGSPGLAAYQSAKWAVNGFSTVLAQEVAPLGIKVTVIEPGGIRTDWAGSSMTIPPISAPYQQTVGAFASMIREYNGREPTDPSKLANLLLAISDMEQPPLRLLVGSDAIQYSVAAADTLAKNDERWRYLSESAGFPSS